MKLRELVYPIYEARIRRGLKGRPQPKHVAIMADGNRRWAREAGFTDISQGHRRGAHKIAELVSGVQRPKSRLLPAICCPRKTCGVPQKS